MKSETAKNKLGTASSATSGAIPSGEELLESKRKPLESSTSRTKPSEERPRRERQPQHESSGTTISYSKMFQKNMFFKKK